MTKCNDKCAALTNSEKHALKSKHRNDYRKNC